MNQSTELMFILDRSGSMHGLEQDTLGGYNSLLEKQRNLYNPCRISTVLFDHEIQILHDRVDIRQVQPVTASEYQPRGQTALLDAMGMMINRLGGIQQYTPSEQRSERVLVVVITDGMENASRKFGRAQIKALVERQQQRFGWEFVFLGANMDAITTAENYGIAPERAGTYVPDAEGTALKYDALDEMVGDFRTGSRRSYEKLERVRCDTRQRG